jgi:hypothetical protein
MAADDIPTDMPAPVVAEPGADIVPFPWAEATSAMAALHAAAATLRGQLDARSLLLPTIVDWEGSYRDDFDTAHTRLTTTAAGLAETLASRAGSIVSAAESAAAQQAANNTAAAEERAAQEARAEQEAAEAGQPQGSSAGRSTMV